MASACSSSSSSKRKREMEENAFHGMAPAPPSRPPSSTCYDVFINHRGLDAPPSPLPYSTCYDVFINHRGPDVKNTMASVLHQLLQRLGVNSFLDSTELLAGDSFQPNIEHAIQNSLVHTAIFSKGYAESHWCLAELDLMLKTRAQIVPVFYGVKPNDLRYPDKGSYSAAFTAYREKRRHMDKVEQWKQALQEVSHITGIEFDPSNGNLGNLCKTTVDTLLIKLKEARNKFKLEAPEHPVALEEAIQELEAKISTIGQSTNGNGKLVGIVGKAGVGKTTLAKEFYDRKHHTFHRSSFLFDVVEAHRNKKMVEMQRKLMTDLVIPLPLSPSDFQPSSPKEGFGVEMIKSWLERWYSKPLIIIDGVDHADQLEALSLNAFLNHGALVIVTCRDASVLQSFEMVKIYEMRGLDLKHGRQLLCWQAFRRSHPPDGREKLVETILKVSGGLPLHLKNLGQEIYSMQNDIDAVNF